MTQLQLFAPESVDAVSGLLRVMYPDEMTAVEIAESLHMPTAHITVALGYLADKGSVTQAGDKWKAK